MERKLLLRITIGLFAVLLLQLVYLTNSFAWCVARDTNGINLGAPDPDKENDTWAEKCCDGRPAHWSSDDMPIPFYIYNGDDADKDGNGVLLNENAIRDAIQAWNDIPSSFFEMEFEDYTDSKDPQEGALVIGFDTTMCTVPGCLSGGTLADAFSVPPRRTGRFSNPKGHGFC